MVSRTKIGQAVKQIGQIKEVWTVQPKSVLFVNFDSFIPLSVILVGILYNLKSTFQQTGQIACISEILFFPNTL